MGHRILNIVLYAGEGVLLLGSALMCFVILLPLFQIQQTIKGNPLWFLPGHDKSAR